MEIISRINKLLSRITGIIRRKARQGNDIFIKNYGNFGKKYRTRKESIYQELRELREFVKYKKGSSGNYGKESGARELYYYQELREFREEIQNEERIHLSRITGISGIYKIQEGKFRELREGEPGEETIYPLM